jgi:hypothetical protein
MDRLDLRPQVLGHRGAIGFVLGIEVVPEGFARRIKDNSTIPCIAGRIALSRRSIAAMPYKAPVGSPALLLKSGSA